MFSVSANHKDLARRIYEEMWNRGNPSLAREIFDRPLGVEQFITHFLVSFPDLQHTIEAMIVDEDQIAVRFTAHGTHLGEWMGFPAAGKVIRYDGVTWARIAHGKIAEHHTWWDKAGLIQQIGGASPDHS